MGGVQGRLGGGGAYQPLMYLQKQSEEHNTWLLLQTRYCIIKLSRWARAVGAGRRVAVSDSPSFQDDL